MNSELGLRVRSIGFRQGTDEDLAILHSIESAVQRERGSDRMPLAVHDYVAFARNLPSQFDDHAWLVEDGAGKAHACGFCWSNTSGDPKVMECDVLVARACRRQGFGSMLFDAIRTETLLEGRSLLTWSTFSGIPAGEAFSRHLEAQVARVNRTSSLQLGDVDWATLENWTRPDRARHLGYSIEIVDGVIPAAQRSDAVKFREIMRTAPRADLDVNDTVVDDTFVEELDRALLAGGRSRWTVFVRDIHGECVGGTEVTFEASDARTAHQHNTGIHPAHRGLGLAKWAKAAMLQRIRVERSEVEAVQTSNAFSNEPMLAINEAVGFKVVGIRTEWQLRVT